MILTLCEVPVSSYSSLHMSALEVIEQIKALPPAEKAQVLDFIRQMEADAENEPRKDYMDTSIFSAAKKNVFAKHSELLKKLAD